MSDQKSIQKDPILSNSSFWQVTAENKKLIDSGFPTIIPFTTFPRLAKYIPGIVPGDYILVTANTSVGKSRFTRKVFIKNILDFSTETGLKLKIFLNSLEENEAKVEQTFVAEYLFLNYGIKGNYYEISNYALTSQSEDMMDKIAEATIWVQKNVLTKLVIVSEPNPYAFYKMIRTYLFEVGKFYHIVKKDGLIISKTKYDPKGKIGWNHYEYNEPQFVIAIFDTFDAASGHNITSKGITTKLTKYEAIRKFSEQDLRGKLCKICKVIGVAVMQQVEDKQKVDNDFRGNKLLDKLKPGLDGLLSCKAVQQHVTLAFGLFDPVRYGEFDYNNYRDLDKLKGSYRSLMILKTRNGTLPSNEMPLFCDFSRDHIEEMPLPDEEEKLIQFYETPPSIY